MLQNPTRQLGKAVLLASECFDVGQSLGGEMLVTGARLLQRQVFTGNTGKMQSQGPEFPATQLLACPRGTERWRQSESVPRRQMQVILVLGTLFTFVSAVSAHTEPNHRVAPLFNKSLTGHREKTELAEGPSFIISGRRRAFAFFQNLFAPH